MNAQRDALPKAGAETYLFASSSEDRIRWLTDALSRSGVVIAVPDASNSTPSLDDRITLLSPQAVFIDFSRDAGADQPGDVHQRLKLERPTLPVIALGSSHEPNTMLTALRAGVDDFVDTLAPPADALRTLRSLMERLRTHASQTRGKTIALLGARAGLGVTTLATNLALCLQERLSQRTHPAPRSGHGGVAMLDLGLPARDGLLYLDTPSSFSFVDGAHNLRRLDLTLIQSALAYHDSGLAVVPLPASLAQVKGISHAESAGLIRRLGDFFDFQIADLGGLSTLDFVAQTVRDADQTWVVCDQSIGSIVSTATLLREMKTRGVESSRFSVVLNKFEHSVDLAARDIAVRLELPLAHVLPARSAALLSAASRGQALVTSARNDPYSQAVTDMADSLCAAHGGIYQIAPHDSRWGGLFSKLSGSFKRNAARI